MSEVTSLAEISGKQKVIEAIRQAKMWKGIHSHYFFCKDILGYSSMEKPTHGKICDMLDGNSKKRKLILVPRGSFKTSIITVGYALRSFIKDPNVRIMLEASKYDPNALRYLQNIKAIVENNPTINWLYGDMKGERWRDTELTVKRQIQHKEPTVSCGSIEVTSVGFHFDKIICDDLVTDTNIGTKEQLAKTIEHLKGLFNILEPNGELIVVGTRWHFGDMYGYIIKEMQKEFDIYVEKAIRDNGTLYFPQRLTKDYLQMQKKLEGAYVFSCQYQNSPVNPEDQLFKTIPTYNSLDEVPKDLHISLIVDPAISLAEKADDTAFSVCGTSAHEDMYVLEDLAGKYNPKEIIDTIFYLHKKWGCDSIGIETVAFQKALKFFCEQEEIKRGIRLPMIELKTETNKSKFMRIQALQPFFERRQILVKISMTELIDQLRMYPKSPLVDRVDALAYQLQLTQKPFMNQLPKDLYPDEKLPWIARRHKIRREEEYDE